MKVLALMLGLVTVPAVALEVGDIAPDFALKASDGRTYQLSDYRGRQTVVLAWFPKAFTSGCTLECKSLAEDGHLIRRYRAVYFMASVDSLETNREFAAAQNADFPLLSDPSRETAQAYGVLRGTVARRHTFYIGPNGRVLAIDRNVKPATSAGDMAAMLERLNTPKRN